MKNMDNSLNDALDKLLAPPVDDSDAVQHIRSILARSNDDLRRILCEGPAVSAARQVGVVGAGLMGIAIAATHLRAGCDVRLFDIDPKVIDTAADRVRTELSFQIHDTLEPGFLDDFLPFAEVIEEYSLQKISTGEINGIFISSGSNTDDRRDIDTIMRRLTVTDDIRLLAPCEFIIETVPEQLDIKRNVFAALLAVIGDDTVIGTNTSTIPISRIAATFPADAEKSKKRLCGFHFFHPVRSRSLLEVIPAETTAPDTVRRAVAQAIAIEKRPMVVGDCPGFLVNRILNPSLSEALELLLEGATIEQIERVSTRFGMAMGPLRILDEIGLDVGMHAGRVLWEAFPDRVIPSPLLVKLLKNGRLGRKLGQGFFRYESNASWDGPGSSDPEIEDLILRWRRSDQPHDDREVAARLLLGMLLEAVRVLEEGKISGMHDIDLASIFALGFPISRGGLAHWVDRFGIAETLAILQQFADLGPRMQPPGLLIRMQVPE